MTEAEIVAFVEDALPGTRIVVASADNGAPAAAWGDTFFIYDPDHGIPPDKLFPFATIVASDYPGFDEASDLDRDGAYRVNAWVGRKTFERTTRGLGDIESLDYTVADRVIPHPLYAKQWWVSVVNPGEVTSETVRTLLTEAHQRAKQRHETRQPGR